MKYPYSEEVERWERVGNAHAANGLVIKAKAAWRVADALREKAHDRTEGESK